MELTSIKKSSTHFQTLSMSSVPSQGSWKVLLNAVSAMLTETGLSSRKGTHSHCRETPRRIEHLYWRPEKTNTDANSSMRSPETNQCFCLYLKTLTKLKKVRASWMTSV